MSSRRCQEPTCLRPAADRCFECGDWFCDTHLTLISVPTYEEPFHQCVCPSCLKEHLAHTDKYGRVRVEPLR
jgi:hypothetical protein